MTLIFIIYPTFIHPFISLRNYNTSISASTEQKRISFFKLNNKLRFIINFARDRITTFPLSFKFISILKTKTTITESIIRSLIKNTFKTSSIAIFSFTILNHILIINSFIKSSISKTKSTKTMCFIVLPKPNVKTTIRK